MTISIQIQYFGYFLLLGNLTFWLGYAWPLQTWLILSLGLLLLKQCHCNMLIAAIGIGFCTAMASFIGLDGWQINSENTHDNHLIQAYVRDPVSLSKSEKQYTLTVHTLNHVVVNDIVLVIRCFKDCPDIKQGETWQMLVRLKPPRSRYNPESFDYERWLFAENIRAIGYLLPGLMNQRIKPVDDSVLNRGGIKALLATLFDQHQSFSTISSLLIGDRSELTSSQRQQLTDAGLSHLIAISGMHVALAFLPGYLLGWPLWLLGMQKVSRRQTVQWITGLLFAFVYAFIAGFAVPSQRAFIMLSALGLASLTGQSMNLWQRLGIATVVILLIEPRATLSTSFWLSYLVTVIIVLFLEVHKRRPWMSLLQLQLSLAWLLPAFQWFIFGQYSLLSIVQNLWAIPLLSFFLMPLAMLLLMSIMVLSWDLTSWFIILIVQGLDVFITLFWDMLFFLDGLNQRSIILASPTLSQALFTIIAAFILWLPISLQLRSALIIMQSLVYLPDKGEATLELRMFDVGQGLAVVFHDKKQTILYDTAYGLDEQVVLAGIWPDWSLKHSISALDYVFVSHSDIDHSGGLQWLKNAMDIHEVISYRGNAQGHNACQAGQRYELNQIKIEVLLPLASMVVNDNNGSCVLLISYHDRRILLSGDIEQYAELQLLKHYPDLAVDVLVVPHHGSRTSSSAALLDQLSPQVALNSSGYLNRFGLPHSEVLARYEQRDIEFLDTSDHGAIDLSISSNGEMKIVSSRQQNPALWRRN